MAKTQDYTTISISMDGVWAGSGRLVDGCIADCSAQFCDDNDESLEVYEMIDEAIENGDDELTVELDGVSRRLTWSIVVPTK